MTHTNTEQPEALYFADVLDNFYSGISRCDATGAAAALRRLHARNLELEASQERLKNALEDIASGEITRSHCVGPHCTEEIGVATADEMASRAAGTLHWHGITQEKQG